MNQRHPVSRRALSRRFQRTALAAALSFCFATNVHAQSSVGSIFGDTGANASVQIENVDTGTRREITADAAGRFTFPQLAPGRYRVVSEGSTKDVQVKVGTGSEVDFTRAANELATVVVEGASTFNPVDVSSVESTTVFTAAQLEQLPIARSVTSVALLAPGTVRGDTGLGNGNLASFGGSSVAENGYYINGFDVTNIRNFLSFAELPFDAIAEQQVKTGGYGAEYGRSLGGVIGLVTKRGTNEWKSGASVYWRPGSLTENGTDVLSRDPARIGTNDPLYVYRSDNTSDRLSYNVWGGGALIKDKLFMFGLVEGQDDTDDIYGRDISEHRANNSPSALLKLDWNITDNHLVEFTGIYNKSEQTTHHYANPTGVLNSGQHGTFLNTSTLENGGEVYIAKYTGYLTDSFTVSAQYGYLNNVNNFQSELPGADCPAIYDSRAPGLPLRKVGCWTEAQFTVRDAAFGGRPDEDTRNAWRIDAEWQAGDHRVRFGLDHEKFESTHAGTTYSGGNYYRYFRASDIFGAGATGDVVRHRTTYSESGAYNVVNNAAYVEDNWQVTDKWMIYAGLRAETFENNNAQGQTFIESDTLFAPRLGFSWDVLGDSSFKVFGNAGRYYIPVASNTNIRASATEYSTETWYVLDGVNGDGTPIIGSVVRPTAVNGALTPPDPRTVAATNLDPMYQDEYILGFQKQLTPNWMLGMRAIHRDVKAGMDDICSKNGFNQWAADNGFDPAFAADGLGIDMANCFIANPGKDVSIALDPTNSGTLQVYTVPAHYLGLPEYQRTYNAVEFFWERSKADNWYMQGSYTFAKSRGNAEGYVNSTLEQEDAGLTQDFDFAAFEQGAYGYLPNDRRHSLKLFGSYDLSDQWVVSANLLIQSGRPVSCYGFIPTEALNIGAPDEGTLGLYSASSFYCPDANGQFAVPDAGADGVAGTADDFERRYRLGNRGDQGRTPWTQTLDLGVSYTPTWAQKKLTLQMTVLNVLNAQTATEWNETSQTTRLDAATRPDYLNDVNYQTPRSVEFVARYRF
ncbi:carboxypeptidase regulatory-like domain-containing protein [Lysobacter sp. 2RAF19]